MNTKHRMSIKKYIIYVLITALAVLAVLNIKWVISAAGNLFSILSPLIIGCILAYLLNLIMVKLEKLYFPRSQKRFINASRRPVCLTLSILLIFVIAALVIGLIVPEIVNIFIVLGDTLPVYGEKIMILIETYKSDFPILEEYISQYLQVGGIDLQSLLSSMVDFAKNGVGDFITSTVTVISDIAGGMINFVIGLIFAIYILFNKEKLAEQLRRITESYMKPTMARKARYFFTTADKCFSSFIVGQCTEAVILGMLCAVGMTILQIPYATTIGTLVGATALIPIVGAYIGAVVGTFMILVVDPIKALWFLIFLLILQQVEGNIIYPKVVGSSIGLPGMWVLAAVTVGGGLLGVPGMLIGVPLTATIYKLVEADVAHRLGEDIPETVCEEAAQTDNSDTAEKENEKPTDMQSVPADDS